MEQIPLISVSSPAARFLSSLSPINESDSDTASLSVRVVPELFRGEDEAGEGGGEGVEKDAEFPKPLIWAVIFRALRRASLSSSFPRRSV